MTEHFLTYEQSLEVKKLGFDEATICVYNSYGHLKGVISSSVDGDYIRKEKYEDRLPAPLKSQFFQWAREKKLSDSCICRYQSRDDGGVYYYYVINHDFGVEETKHYKEGFYSYEEAEDACINEIIEILKLK